MKYHEIDSDTSIGQNVNKDWKEQDALNLIDMIEQKMNGGIKPMKDQFPGEVEDSIDPKDLFERDIIQERNVEESEMSFSEKVEKKLAKLANEGKYKGVSYKITSSGKYPTVAFYGICEDLGIKTKFQTNPTDAAKEIKKLIDESIKDRDMK